MSGTPLIPVRLTIGLLAHNVDHINNHLPLPSPAHHQNNCFFHLAQAIKVNWSAPYIFPQTHRIPSNVSLRPFGMEAKPGVESPAKEGWSHHLEQPYAAIGMVIADAPIPPMTIITSLPDVERRITVLRDALKHRKEKALTPYKPDSWEQLLLQYGLLAKYLPRYAMVLMLASGKFITLFPLPIAISHHCLWKPTNEKWQKNLNVEDILVLSPARKYRSSSDLSSHPYFLWSQNQASLANSGQYIISPTVTFP